MKKLILFLGLFVSFISVWAQDAEVSPTKSFINRENLTRIYKASAESGFFGEEDGTYSLNASIFGLKALVDPKVAVDTNYLQSVNGFLRRFELNMKLGVGDNNKITSFSPGIKYAIVNRRDATDGSLRNTTSTLISAVNRAIVNTVSRYSKKSDPGFRALQAKLGKEKVTVEDFDEEFQTLFAEEWQSQIDKLRNDPIFPFLQNKLDSIDISNFNDYIEKEWEYEKTRVGRRALLTLEAVPKFESGFEDLSLELKFLKGLNVEKVKKTETNLEIVTSFQATNDSIIAENSISERSIWNTEASLAKVLIKDSKGDSRLEFKSGIGYQSILKGVREDEKADVFSFNVVLTARLSKNLYFPLEFKYDPEDANVLSKFSLTWNVGTEE